MEDLNWIYQYKLDDGIHVIIVVKRYSDWSKKYTASVDIREIVSGDRVFVGRHWYIGDFEKSIFQKNDLNGMRVFPRMKLGDGSTIHLKRGETKKVVAWIRDVIKPIEDMRDDIIDEILDNET